MAASPPQLRVLIIEPHSDDGVISAGGLLGRLKASHDLYFAMIVASDLTMHHGGLVTRDQRIDEYAAYVDHFGGHWIRRLGDGTVLPLDADSNLDQYPRKDLVRTVEEIISIARPNLLLVNGPSFHHDHTAVYEAVIAALRPTARYLPDEVLIMENPTYVHSSGPAFQFVPDTYAALSEEELTEKVLVFEQCFPSQVRSDENYLSTAGIRSWARYRGMEARVEYAEAFRTFIRRI